MRLRSRTPGCLCSKQAHLATHTCLSWLLEPPSTTAQAGLSVTRAKVRTYATSKSSGHTFYVMDAKGGPPDK